MSPRKSSDFGVRDVWVSGLGGLSAGVEGSATLTSRDAYYATMARPNGGVPHRRIVTGNAPEGELF